MKVLVKLFESDVERGGVEGLVRVNSVEKFDKLKGCFSSEDQNDLNLACNFAPELTGDSVRVDHLLDDPLRISGLENGLKRK